MKIILIPLFLLSISKEVLCRARVGPDEVYLGKKHNMLPENNRPFYCYDIRNYIKINQQINECFKAKWHPVHFGQNNELHYQSGNECCYKREMNLHDDKLIRKDCEFNEYGMDSLANNETAKNAKMCREIGITVDDDYCLRLRSTPLTKFCEQLLADNLKPVVKTKPPIVAEPGVKSSLTNGSAHKLCGFQILLSTLLQIFYIYVNRNVI